MSVIEECRGDERFGMVIAAVAPSMAEFLTDQARRAGDTEERFVPYGTADVASPLPETAPSEASVTHIYVDPAARIGGFLVNQASGF